MTTTAAWSTLWWWWIVGVAFSFLAIELAANAAAHGDQEWTLSDTIRRWAKLRRWLAPVTCGFACWLLVHLFRAGQ